MAIRIGFLTGSRCEYGLAKRLLKSLHDDKRIKLDIFPNGMHLLKKFGYTLSELVADGFNIQTVIKTYREKGNAKVYEFTNSVDRIYRALNGKKLNTVFVIGDRIEAYASALAAHFLKIPVIHLGGGAITTGAVDNMYRYNITYLSSIHLATSRKSYERLLSLEVIDKNTIWFVGSPAVDAIIEFKKRPISITNLLPDIRGNKFALMTFHPVTLKQEPISNIMDASINTILSYDCQVLITYPNNDEGYESILRVIDKWKKNKKVFICKSLGADYYYSALNDCSFIIGNSSSGVIEAPYFKKTVLNIGSRQDGRDKDIGVTDVRPEVNSVIKCIKRGFSDGWKRCNCNKLHGDGKSVVKIKEAILQTFD